MPIKEAIKLYKIKCEEFEEEPSNLEETWECLDQLYNIGAIMIKMNDERYNMELAIIDLKDERRNVAQIAVISFPVNKGLKDLNKWLEQLKRQKDFSKIWKEEMKK